MSRVTRSFCGLSQVILFPVRDRVISPTITPNQSVQNLIITVAPAAIPLVNPANMSSPAMLPSATASPPGIIDTAPTKEEKEKTKVLSSNEALTPKPFRTKYIAMHSNPQEITLIATATRRIFSRKSV